MERSKLLGELEACHERAFSWALGCCRWDEAEAQETLQVAMLKVIDGRARFGGGSEFSTWFFAVVRRTAAERRRRVRVRTLGLSRFAQTRETPAPPGVDPESAVRAGEVRDALLRLPTRQREVLHLVFYEGLRVEDAAGVMGVSLGSARTHYARGKARLREWL